MRDPERIDRICALLADAWKRTPDQRLGQLISNLSPEIDPWHIEDETTYGADKPDPLYSWADRLKGWPPR